MLSSVEILILSIIQGVTEFLPVSSAAHLVLVSKYYAFTNQSILIDICLHLGSLIAIIVYFRNDLFHFIRNKSFLIKCNKSFLKYIIIAIRDPKCRHISISRFWLTNT